MTIVLNTERLSLPPVELIACKPIARAVERYNAAEAAAWQAGQDLDRARQGRDEAETADARAYADLLARSPRAADPGTPHVDAHDARAEAAKRTYEARKLVRDDALDALTEALEEHGHTWHEQVAQVHADAHAAYLIALDQLAERHAELCRTQALARFTAGREIDGEPLPVRWTNPEPAGTVPMRHSGGDLGVLAAIDALRQFGTPPTPRPQPTYIDAFGEQQTVQPPRTGRLHEVEPAAFG